MTDDVKVTQADKECCLNVHIALDQGGADGIDEARRIVARHRLASQPQWCADMEAAPKNEKIIAWGPGNKKARNQNARPAQHRTDIRLERYKWRFAGESPEAPYTHWMPLPTPPETE